MDSRATTQMEVDVDAFRSSSPDLYPPPIGGGYSFPESQCPANLMTTLSGASRALRDMCAVCNVWSMRVSTVYT